jgi:UDP-N-acetylglucosamine 2-epimerase (non-hydrolysing)
MKNSNKKVVLVVFGTRPEAIKMAPLISELKKYSNLFDLKICVTGQHREMLDQVLNIFEIIPDYDLEIMKQNQNLTDLTAGLILKISNLLNELNPDILLIHGDTTTAMAASLAGYYNSINVGHIEAGLRTNNIYSPYPEELNRQIISRIAKWNFAPTITAHDNLLSEGVNKSSIFITGNTVIDSLILTINKIEQNSKKELDIINDLNKSLSKFDWLNEKFILITGHRRENFGQGFIEICNAIKELAFKYPDLNFVYPVHLNPKVQKPVIELLYELKNIHLISPLEYEPFIYLMNKSYFVLTDSGGIQEEAPSLGKPVLVMREVTERPEAVIAGTVLLVGADKNKIVDSVSKLIEDNDLYSKMRQAHNPYGDGKASQRIAEVIMKAINLNE